MRPCLLSIGYKWKRSRAKIYSVQVCVLNYISEYIYVYNNIHNINIYKKRSRRTLAECDLGPTSSWVITRHTQILYIKVGSISGTRRAGAPEHLVVDDHIKGLTDHAGTILGSNELFVDIKASLEGGPVVLGPQLDQDGMPGGGRGGVGIILGGDDGARVEGIKADLAVALPLGQVDLGGPAVDAVQPEGGPAPLGDGGDEIRLEIQPAVGLDREVLFGVDGPAVVGVVGSPRIVGLELEVGVVDDGGLGGGHEGRAVVGVAPGVVVFKVGLEVVLAVETGVWDQGRGSFLEGALPEGVGVCGCCEAGACEEG